MTETAARLLSVSSMLAVLCKSTSGKIYLGYSCYYGLEVEKYVAILSSPPLKLYCPLQDLEQAEASEVALHSNSYAQVIHSV